MRRHCPRHMVAGVSLHMQVRPLLYSDVNNTNNTNITAITAITAITLLLLFYCLVMHGFSVCFLAAVCFMSKMKELKRLEDKAGKKAQYQYRNYKSKERHFMIQLYFQPSMVAYIMCNNRAVMPVIIYHYNATHMQRTPFRYARSYQPKSKSSTLSVMY